ncbi:MAG: hypothetical protein D6736_19865 [Nitrospinota bacterium]|nr:MAG: hypothetical protein D6736_19865 [Nitrospinota bacterium]
MIERYLVVAGRIRQELAELERVVSRAERAVAAARRHPEDQDLYLDSAVLNLHGFYGQRTPGLCRFLGAGGLRGG